MTRSATRTPVTLRAPKRGDGAALHRFVLASEALEANTRYAYLLLATHFAPTVVVAEAEDGEVVGFVAAYRPPTRPEAIFVWQIGVAERARGQGLALRLLRALLEREACRDCRYLEATVGVTNEPSSRLFEAIARDLGVACRKEEGFVAADFGDEVHEDELLYRIGPLEREG